MSLLTVNKLRKVYPSFTLDDVSFSLEKGHIMGFIGRNGAGKSTTLKTMLNFVHRDGGEVLLEGEEFTLDERMAKGKIGLVFNGFDYYPKTKLKKVAKVTSKFYDKWNNETYLKLLKMFSLDENKKVSELSSGMKVKFALALALSHDAEILILDEPTSGLDPVSRDEILDLFEKLVESGNRCILFSTHIISDLEKCANDIVYIKTGKIIANQTKEEFQNSYILVTGKEKNLPSDLAEKCIHVKHNKGDFSALAKAETKDIFKKFEISKPDLETIMVYIERGDENEEFAL